MKFNTFLITQIDGIFPIDKIKQDLSYFKSVFNYATKTDDIYSNLIDNIVFILKSKFGRFDIIFNSSITMYNELMLILTPQIPQFLMIQKKQILENADTFASLNNWGETFKRSVLSKISSMVNGENLESYLPIDTTDKDPYSSTQNKKDTERDGDEKVEQGIVDYLEFYKRLKWNIADVELNSILKPYYSLFKLLYSNAEYDETPTSDFNERLNKLEKEVPLIVEEVDNLENIKANKSDVYDKQESDEKYYQKEDVYNKTESDNKYYQKSQVYTKQESDNRFALKGSEAPYYTKQESDNKFPSYNYMNNNYYNRTQSDERYGSKQAVETNTNVIGSLSTSVSTIQNDLQNTKQRFDNYYNKSECDNKYVQLNLPVPQEVPKLYTGTVYDYDDPKTVVNKRYVDDKFIFNKVQKTLSQAGARWFATRRPGNDLVIYFGWIDNFSRKFGFTAFSKVLSITPLNEYSNNQCGIAFNYRSSADILYYSITQGFSGDNYNSYSNTISFSVLSLR